MRFESYAEFLARINTEALGSSQMNSLERRINGAIQSEGGISEEDAQRILQEVRGEIYGLAREMGALFHAGCSDCGCKC